MLKELFQLRTKVTSFNITANRIDSVMNKNLLTSGCRVFDGKHVGVAGVFGEPTDQTWAQAEANLALKLPYSSSLETGVRKQDNRSGYIGDELFLKESELLLERLSAALPGFSYNNMIKYIECEYSLSNDLGLDYFFADGVYSIEIVVRAPESKNILDTFVGFETRIFDSEAIFNRAKSELSAYLNKVELPENMGKLPVVIHPVALASKLLESLHGIKYATGTSLFSNKCGQKLFNERFSLYLDRSSHARMVPFFDMEGVAIEKSMLIENGVIRSAYTDKELASKYSLPVTGSAAGPYDCVPSADIEEPNYIKFAPNAKSVKDLLGGRLAVFVVMASGGDWTSEGNFASPVQLAYLTDGEKLIGRLPELNLSANLFEMFGDDYIGTSEEFFMMDDSALVLSAKVSVAE